MVASSGPLSSDLDLGPARSQNLTISCRRLGLRIGVADEPGKRNYLEGRVHLKLDGELV